VLDLAVSELFTIVLLYLAGPALFLFAVYWVTRLAVRHETRRSSLRDAVARRDL
jgi:hypothetical protein